jgi:hypothetical protein
VNVVDAAEGFSVNWGTAVVSSAGGLFRLCWSDGSRESSLPSALLVDMGALHIIGPAPLVQDKTCVAGLTCSFDGIAGHYSTSDNDQFYVLDTCGQDRGWGPCRVSPPPLSLHLLWRVRVPASRTPPKLP